MPPCFSAASAILEAASNDNTAAASARRLRIFPSLPSTFSASWRANLSNDSMVGGPRNKQGPCQHWQFGLKQSEWRFSAPTLRRMSAGNPPEPSHLQLVAALQIENFAGLVGCRHLE